MNFPFPYFLKVIVPALIAIGIGVLVNRLLESQISKFGKKRDILESQIYLMKVAVRWITFFATLFVVAWIFGIAVGSLWISISSILAMIVIGFVAGWSLIANFLAALIVIIWRPFEIGDNISILPDDITGKVIDINLFYGIIEDEEGNEINVPNVTFLQKFVKVDKPQPEEKKA